VTSFLVPKLLLGNAVSGTSASCATKRSFGGVCFQAGACEQRKMTLMPLDSKGQAMRSRRWIGLDVASKLKSLARGASERIEYRITFVPRWRIFMLRYLSHGVAAEYSRGRKLPETSNREMQSPGRATSEFERCPGVALAGLIDRACLESGGFRPRRNSIAAARLKTAQHQNWRVGLILQPLLLCSLMIGSPIVARALEPKTEQPAAANERRPNSSPN
jgi:hypothetical protein